MRHLTSSELSIGATTCHKFIQLFMALTVAASLSSQTKITFPSEDGLPCSADLYLANQAASTPFIVLFHQAGYSRGEYKDIAPRLNQLGFSCMAVDARSGGKAGGIQNETAQAAQKAGKPMGYLDALPDLLAALKYARKHYSAKYLIAWGSSYSASLVIHLAGDDPNLVNGVLAFSPGEYFRVETSAHWVEQSAAKIQSIPLFITSGPSEGDQWKGIYDAIPSASKTFFLPVETARLHGSSVLRSNLGDAEFEIKNPLASMYWVAVEAFLNREFKPPAN